MDQLLSPDLNYFGVSTPQAPFDWKDFELFVNAAKKRPNLLMFFSGWDRDYPSDKIVTTWRCGSTRKLVCRGCWCSAIATISG